MGNTRVATLYKKAFTMTLIAEFRTSNTRTLRSDDATVDVLGMCLYASPIDDRRCYFASVLYKSNRGTIFISAWASELLIFLRRQVRRPGARDKQQSTDLTLFLFCSSEPKTIIFLQEVTRKRAIAHTKTMCQDLYRHMISVRIIPFVTGFTL